LSEVQTELNTLYARSEAINLAERKRERKASLTGGLMEAGLSVLGAGPIAEIGSSRGSPMSAHSEVFGHP
jgi:hypothetical protein